MESGIVFMNSPNLFSMRGKVVLITGASGYLGAAMSRCLAEAGAHVLLNGRNREKIDYLVEQLKKDGLSAESAIFDITAVAEISAFFSHRVNAPLDVLINNAYSGKSGSVEICDSQDYRDSYNVSVVAAHNLFQTLLPSFRVAKRLNGDASIINIASMYGMVSPDLRIYSSKLKSNPPFYGAAKAALIQWTKYTACEFGGEGIRVNALSPGAFPSDAVKLSESELVAQIEKKIPLARVGLPAELQGPVLFLASSASSYMTGENLVVDGGWTAW